MFREVLGPVTHRPPHFHFLLPPTLLPPPHPVTLQATSSLQLTSTFMSNKLAKSYRHRVSALLSEPVWEPPNPLGSSTVGAAPIKSLYQMARDSRRLEEEATAQAEKIPQCPVKRSLVRPIEAAHVGSDPVVSTACTTLPRSGQTPLTLSASQPSTNKGKMRERQPPSTHGRDNDGVSVADRMTDRASNPPSTRSITPSTVPRHDKRRAKTCSRRIPRTGLQSPSADVGHSDAPLPSVRAPLVQAHPRQAVPSARRPRKGVGLDVDSATAHAVVNEEALAPIESLSMLPSLNPPIREPRDPSGAGRDGPPRTANRSPPQTTALLPSWHTSGDNSIPPLSPESLRSPRPSTLSVAPVPRSECQPPRAFTPTYAVPVSSTYGSSIRATDYILQEGPQGTAFDRRARKERARRLTYREDVARANTGGQHRDGADDKLVPSSTTSRALTEGHVVQSLGRQSDRRTDFTGECFVYVRITYHS